MEASDSCGQIEKDLACHGLLPRYQTLATPKVLHCKACSYVTDYLSPSSRDILLFQEQKMAELGDDVVVTEGVAQSCCDRNAAHLFHHY